ncbi:MAG: metallophosphoesterase family protein [Longimicrobiales bacterium]|nr:metallophosphoesterase family protein [Longimicrobiales bacterium]
MTVGVISDTHGLLRSEAVEALRGSDVIVHAGDVGDRRILERLSELAPVRAVRGNTDRGSWAARLPGTDVVSAGPAHLFVLHDIDTLDLDPGAAGMDAVIFGHSHRPEIRRSDGVLYFNPGAAGHRRFELPVTVGRLTVSEAGALEAEIVELAGAA